MDDEAVRATAAALNAGARPNDRRAAPPPAAPAAPVEKPPTLYVKLPSRDDPAFRRIGLILTMFPGTEPMVVYFADTKKRAGARCVIHPALVEELRDMLGAENVIVQ